MTIRVVQGTKPSPLAELATQYLVHCRARGLMPTSLKQYRYSIDAVFLPWCEEQGITQVGQLDQRRLDAFTVMLHDHRTAAGQPLSRSSIRTYIRPIGLMLNWAKGAAEDVKAKPQMPRRERRTRDVLSRDELDLLEEAMPSERDKLIIRIFADCGLRLNELTQLDADDIVKLYGKHYLRVLGKRDRPRDVPIPIELLHRLEWHIAKRPKDRISEAIFLAHRGTRLGEHLALTSGGVYQVVKEAVARAGITKRVYPHLLRHSWMTELLRNGLSADQISPIAGASPAVISECYAHLNRDDGYDAMIRALSPRNRR
jgi:site-specific recombinase XerD